MDLGIEGLGHATEIGAGASAIVYKARQLDLDREVAVKVLSVTDEAFVRRFRREAKTLGKLSQNPGIVTVYDTGVTGAGQPFLILELCDSSLLDQLKADGAFEPRQACRAMAEVADAVAAAHRGGVIHRDLKPGNVLLSPMGRYMVTDFGISTVTGATMGQTNSVGFTAGYVAPETLTGEDAATPADVYALGATLFHTIAGKAPFVDPEKNSNLLALAQRVINDPVPDLRADGVEDNICKVIEVAMAKDAATRPTATELAVLLRAVADGRPPDLAAVVGAGTGAAASVDATVADGELVDEDEVSGDQSATAEHAAVDVPAAGADVDGVAAGTAVVDSPSPALVSAAAAGGAAAPPMAPIDQTSVDATPGSSPANGPGEVNGILDHTPAAAGGALPPSEVDRRYLFTEDDRRGIGPLVVGAIVGLIVLVAVGAFLITRGDDETATEGDGDDSVVAGPDISANENESFNQDGDGTQGSLGDVSSTTLGNVRVPSVVGSSAAAARRELERNGFQVNEVGRASNSVPTGDVISQDPGSGTMAPTGTVITIFVSSEQPRETVTIPTVAGMARDDAVAELTDAGLASTVTEMPSDTVPSGDVISSTPEAGTTVNVGTSVELLVSSGPGVPECSEQIGLTQAAATANFEGAGLAVTVTSELSSAPLGEVTACVVADNTAALVVSAGTGAELCSRAVGTSRSAATTLLEGAGLTVDATGTDSTKPANEVLSCSVTGTAATITYSVPASPQQCPPGVVGMTQPAATAALEAAGIATVVPVPQASDTVPNGSVISCSISGTTATITVSSGSNKIAVPDVTDQTVAQATTQIEGVGLVVGTTSTVESEKPVGRVVRTTPAAGAMVNPGGTVNLVLSRGPATGVTVPNAIGRFPNAVRTELVGLGLGVNVVNNPAGPNASGLVSAQDPAAGTVVPPGTIVTIVVDVVSGGGDGP